MRPKAVLVLGIAMTAAVSGFTWRAFRSDSKSMVREPELQWLQREFALDNEVFARIAELHRRYTAECEPMCARLRASDAEVARLIASQRQVTQEVSAAINRSNELVADCQHRMLEHFYAVAREMPPEQAKRYLTIVTPIAAHPEQGWMRIKP